MKFTISILLSTGTVLVLLAIYLFIHAHISNKVLIENKGWEITLYQKFELSIDDIVLNFTSANVVGTGSSGVVYKVTTSNGITLAVKKMWSAEESGAFNSEIQTLGSIRHKNIIRLLGWGSNKKLKLLFYDYLPNGSLSSFLHGSGKAKWETRYDVILGVAHALSYLHHDCLPAIMHGNVKAMNLLLGPGFQPYLADFGLSRTARENDHNTNSNLVQRHYLASSYGYMVPEHASMQPITEKSDVYSYGLVLLEVLTVRHPLDPTLPGGADLVQGVKNHLASKGEPSDILDPKLRGRADPTMHVMLETLAVSFLCLSTSAEDRPMTKGIVAMLKKIRPIESSRVNDDVLEGGLREHSSSPPAKNIVSHEPSNYFYNFSDDSIS